MKGFLIKTLVYGILLIGLCYGLQFMADRGLRKSNSNDFKNWTMIVQGEMNAELLITGSSRAMRMIDPRILEDETGLVTYNLGMEGARLQSQLSRWNTYLANNKKPKIIVQTVDLMSMGHAKTVFKKQQFLPFLHKEFVYDALEPVDNKLFIDRYFPLYKYHGYMDEFKEGISLFLGKSSSKKYTEYRGYESKDKKWNTEFQQMKDTLTNDTLIHPPKLVTEGFEILNEMITDCQSKNIQLVLIFTPQYKGLTELQVQTNSLISGFEELGKKENVHFLNYAFDPICNDTTYFYNAMHLNKLGAEIYSKNLSNDLKKLNLY